MSRLQARLDVDSVFADEHAIERVELRSVKGGVAVFAGQGVRFAIQTAATVILARLLTPDDFGLVAMATLFVGFAQVFKDAGLSTATIQTKAITRQQVSALFWWNVIVSLAVMLIVAASAPLVAAYFDSPRLVPVIAVLSLSFLIGGLAIQHDALLRRALMFRALATTQIVSQALNLLVAVSVAYVLPSERYWALIAGVLASVACSTVMTFYYCPMLPSRVVDLRAVGSMLAFGGQLMGFEFVNYFARNLDNMLVGRYLGATPLGLYSKAYQLFMLPITQVRMPVVQVALPVMSRLSDDAARYRRYYVAVAEATASLTAPLAVYCLIEARLIVDGLLGSQWIGAARAFQILAIAGVFQPAASTVGLVMVSLGRADRQLKNGLVNSLVLAVAFVAGLPWGIDGVAAGFTAGSALVVFPMLIYGFHQSPIRLMDFWRATWPAVVASALAGALGLIAASSIGDGSPASHVLFGCVYAACYIALSFIRPSAREGYRILRQSLSGIGGSTGVAPLDSEGIGT